ncbi:septal ring lytic transglycosylase RlpA family protein [Variovorax sp. HJSM1_2]|uniref:septal ring lytic transglycosylase RlpA family protein n=1 Tax=Variovorax sp. HJSM1_2 TaxID=3366263 RepID=UPI003BD69EF6
MRKVSLRRHFSVGFWAALCLCTAAIAHADDGPTLSAATAARPTTTPKTQVGNASWYGHKFHRKRTASGALFDVEALTAAHRSLPLHSWARVTALGSGKSVVVQINDRGPHTRNRLIDVSHAAAEELGILARGVAKVSVEPCESIKSCFEPESADDNKIAQADHQQATANSVAEP